MWSTNSLIIVVFIQASVYCWRTPPNSHHSSADRTRNCSQVGACLRCMGPLMHTSGTHHSENKINQWVSALKWVKKATHLMRVWVAWCARVRETPLDMYYSINQRWYGRHWAPTEWMIRSFLSSCAVNSTTFFFAAAVWSSNACNCRSSMSRIAWWLVRRKSEWSVDGFY